MRKGCGGLGRNGRRRVIFRCRSQEMHELLLEQVMVARARVTRTASWNWWKERGKDMILTMEPALTG